MSQKRVSVCPHLPVVEAEMNHRCLTDLEKHSPEFYFKAIQYGHYLWQTGHAGRAILAITRALYADIPEGDPVLKEWPLPYAALRWIIENHSSDDFPGNPRISFQHQATRLRGDREGLRRARAWAVWALIREARPSLQGDLDDPVKERGHEQIEQLLIQHGTKGEDLIWKKALLDKVNHRDTEALS